MHDKIISIIIPCYNVEKYIERCFDSLKVQTIGFDNMECIFVNDASTDNTLQILYGFEREYPDNIIVINFEENQRQGTARNVAIQYASAPYIGYVDADDWVEPEMFKKMVDTLQRYDCDFVECGFDYAKDENNRRPTKSWGNPGYMDLTIDDVRKEFIRSKVALVLQCDKVFKKSFLLDNDIYYPEKVLNEDIFYIYLVFVYAKSYYYMDDVFYHYFVNEGGTVRNKKAEYQFSKMPITYAFLNTCIERGLMNDHNKEIIEWLFLERYYVYMLWEIFEYFPERAYDKYKEMKNTILKCVPDYKTNTFRKMEGNEFDDFMLKLLDYDLTEKEFGDIRLKMVDKIKAEDAQVF